MNNELTNTASAVGSYNGLPTSLTSQAVVVALVSGLSIVKTADKTSWADGLLTYTITVNNQATSSYTAPIITDVLDNTLVDFVDGSVIINDTVAEASQYKYDTTTHTLTVNLADIAPSTSSIVKFQVKKKA